MNEQTARRWMSKLSSGPDCGEPLQPSSTLWIQAQLEKRLEQARRTESSLLWIDSFAAALAGLGCVSFCLWLVFLA